MLSVSIGCNCAMAYNIRHTFKTPAAFPFDWCLTPIDAAIYLFKNGLKHRIESEFLRLSKWGGSIENTLTGIRYVHDFDVSGDWAAAIDSVARKYKARTQRLLSLRSEPCEFYFNAAPATYFTPQEMSAMRDPLKQNELRRVVFQTFPVASLHIIDHVSDYGEAPEDAKWAGCSKGWREALMRAQDTTHLRRSIA